MGITAEVKEFADAAEVKAADVMAALDAAGKEQTRRISLRHGAPEPLFGVRYAVLAQPAQQIGTDHALALGLWATGNHDARELAAKIADSTAVTRQQARRWLADAGNYMAVGSVAGVVAGSPHARALSDEWRDSPDEWTASAGWLLVAFCAERHEVFSEGELAGLLSQIEAEIHRRPNRVRHEMNQAVIAIALRSEELCSEATEAARRIGKVAVDHGKTGCKTPDAVGYIERAVAHRARRARR